MKRSTFLLGFVTGMIVGAAAAMVAQRLERESPTAARQFSPPIPGAVPAGYQVLPRATPWATPPGRAYEFNGQTYYIVPLATLAPGG